jgi:hypothetical protein
MRIKALSMLAGVVVALLAAPDRVPAAQQYTCGLTSCTCSGRADCTDLINSDWCTGNTVKCGKDAGLPPGKCSCKVLPAASGRNPVPDTKVRPQLQSK